jgi:Family of unknown function (DUF6478)
MSRQRFFNRLWPRARAAWWRRQADGAVDMDLADLRRLRGEARQVRREVERLIVLADDRLSPPVIGSNRLPRQVAGDWAWRPAVWRTPVRPAGVAAAPSPTELDGETALFHDCRASEVTIRQIRNRRETDLAPFGLTIETLRFDGSFLSLAVTLPEAAAGQLGARHLVRLDVVVECERPTGFLARLNLRHGPNAEQIVQSVPAGDGERSAEFDLAHTGLGGRRVERAWIDLFIEAPEMNRVTLRDLTVSRRPRAEL